MFIFVKNYADEGKIARFDEIRGFEAKPARRTARGQSGRHLPHSCRAQQTGIRSAAENSQEVSADQPRLAAARLATDVPYGKRKKVAGCKRRTHARRRIRSGTRNPGIGQRIIRRTICGIENAGLTEQCRPAA